MNVINSEFDEFETALSYTQSHHYETTALSGFISNTTDFNFATISLGLRLEVFEQERIDLLDGASYLDQTTIEVLPSISFIKSLTKVILKSFNIFTSSISGKPLKVTFIFLLIELSFTLIIKEIRTRPS